MDNADKGWVWIREQARVVCFYRVIYGEKRERVLSVPYSEVMSRRQEIRECFTNDSNFKKLNRYFLSFESRNKEKLVEKKTFLSASQISAAMSQIEESIAELVKADQKCEKPENTHLAHEIWKAWTPIRQLISNASGWNIKEADSKKALSWGSVGKKEEGTNA
ncbi:hypothetical protein JQX08_01305 [Pseudomonas sp. UL073]|uniref:Uncharacterized protein n=1 Tax=Zestomonas insulae TaxID=2809017 RepID=A0ABS2I856_9GAMM|nr:hypothetical protein [Pseudomonas insulae]MBM7059334.1 hypothetical protein [Pseudomonas insulae]